jgi:hypothetical protein
VAGRTSQSNAIRAFAGTDPENAVVEPGAITALTEFDRQVLHYEVLEDILP